MTEFFIRSRFPFCKGCEVARNAARNASDCKIAHINCKKIEGSKTGSVNIISTKITETEVHPALSDARCPVLAKNPNIDFLEGDSFVRLNVKPKFNS